MTDVSAEFYSSLLDSVEADCALQDALLVCLSSADLHEVPSAKNSQNLSVKLNISTNQATSNSTLVIHLICCRQKTNICMRSCD